MKFKIIFLLIVIRCPVGIYFFKVNNGNNKTIWEIRSKNNNKDTGTTLMLSFWSIYCYFWTDFTHCCDISIVELDASI